MLASQGVHCRAVRRPQRIAHRDRHLGHVRGRCRRDDPAGELHEFGVGGLGLGGEAQAVVRRDLRGVVSREPQQKLGLGQVPIVHGGDQVEDELDVVALEQRPQQLRRQVTVAVVDLVEVLDAMRLARYAGVLARPSRGGVPPPPDSTFGS